MFKKILIANRGEIAVRVIKTARRLGIKTVAVYSEADRNSLHVSKADEAVFIGPTPPQQSYLLGDKILSVAKQHGCQGIHPGYGFLSENPEFAAVCEGSGVTFIGPTSQSIRLMGSKSAAKSLMIEAGVPVLPGYQGEEQSESQLKKHAKTIGYPVLLKAAAGGGGKGMRLVQTEAEFKESLASAKREALSAFGDDEFLVEKYLSAPRHVEVQIFGDSHGNLVHLFERDCSLQRRHQKVIEEAPAPFLPSPVRQKLHTAAIDAARAIDYIGAGTVEFLFDGREDVYFMEMNTRLQVEHPVTESITQVDLVEWQLRVAAGETLPLSQSEITVTGHSVEARLYAEDTDSGFLPSSGQLTTLKFPQDVRVDTGVKQDSVISPNYDPMIAKIICHGTDRTQALSKLSDALKATFADGLKTNTAFLIKLTQHPAFAEPGFSTHFIDDNLDSLQSQAVDDAYFFGALIATQYNASGATKAAWDNLLGFQINTEPTATLWLKQRESILQLRITKTREVYQVTCLQNSLAKDLKAELAEETLLTFSFFATGENDDLFIEIDGQTKQVHVSQKDQALRIWVDGEERDLEVILPFQTSRENLDSETDLTAPMPGTVVSLPHEAGAQVKKGDPLLVMEAMKMEHTIKAPSDGVIHGYRASQGELVQQGALLVDFEPSEV